MSAKQRGPKKGTSKMKKAPPVEEGREASADEVSADLIEAMGEDREERAAQRIEEKERRANKFPIPDDFDVAKGIITAIGLAIKLFTSATGLDEFEARTCAYYVLTTWCMSHFNAMPILNVTGATGTGKTSTLRCCNLLAFKPVMFSGRKITNPVLRDNLAEANNGTAIIDEADDDQSDIEGFLTLRYLRETAVAAKKEPAGDGSWITEHIDIWGATVLHKRDPYKDPALEGRSITVYTAPKLGLVFTDPTTMATELDTFKPLAYAVGERLEMPEGLELPPQYELFARVIDSYLPVIRLAQKANDKDYLENLWKRAESATKDLKEGQTYEPRPLIVQAFIACIAERRNTRVSSIAVEGQMLKWVRENHGKNITAWQASKILRAEGFEVKRSGGPNRVTVDFGLLVKVCQKMGIQDEKLLEMARSAGFSV